MKKLYLAIPIILFLFVQNKVIYSQQIAIDQAEAFFESREYKKAIPIYKKLVAFKDKDSDKWLFRLGYCYLQNKDFLKADTAFMEVVNVPDVEHFLRFGELKRMLGQYDEAITLFNQYITNGGQKVGLAKLWINSSNYAKEYQTMSKWNIVQNKLFLKGIYTGGCYFRDSLWFGYKDVVTITVGDKVNPHSIYMSSGVSLFSEYKANDNLLGTKYYIGGISFSRKSNDVIYSIQDSEASQTSDKKLNKHGISIHYVNTLNLAYGKHNGKTITAIKEFYFNSKEHSCIHPYITDNGKTCYFASDMAGGLGGFDIYKIEKVDTGWSKPVNLGDQVNTLGDEMYPYEYHDSILFFSSDGLLGHGGADIFKCNVFGNNISKPTNLGLPVNSTYDDFGISFMTSNTGYFFSNRNALPETDDMFTFDFPLEIDYDTTKGVVVDYLTLNPLPNTKITIVGDDSSITTTVTDSLGRFTFAKMVPNIKYKITAQKTKYHDKEIVVTSNADGTIVVEMELDPILTINDVFTLNDILFEYRDYRLTQPDLIILDRVSKVMINNPNIVFELSAHTDARGEGQENMVLSQNRAQSTVYYLLSKGVSTNQLVAVGYGESKLKNKCGNDVHCSEPEHLVNRRVEIKVIKVN